MRRRTRVCIVLAGFAAASIGGTGSALAADASFQSPSRNIVCSLTGGSNANTVQCWLMSSRCWNADVGDFFVYAWSMRRNGRVHRICPSDFVPPQSTLRYGRSVRRGVIRCTSQKAGMRCRSSVSGHGFLLSRGKQRTF